MNTKSLFEEALPQAGVASPVPPLSEDQWGADNHCVKVCLFFCCEVETFLDIFTIYKGNFDKSDQHSFYHLYSFWGLNG